MPVTLDLFTTSLELDDHTIATARETPRGWYWFSNVGRVGRKLDFPNAEAALRAAARSMGLTITDVVGKSS